MVVTKTVHWGNAGTEPAAGVNDDYAVNEQPVAEWDNWFNKATETDIAALITALQNVTTGHDHDGVNSKTVDASGVINTPSGTIVSTNVQDAINELDEEYVGGTSYSGNSTVNRAIPHGLGKVPKLVIICRATQDTVWYMLNSVLHYEQGSLKDSHSVTAMDATNFYVGNASSYTYSANVTGTTYDYAVVG